MKSVISRTALALALAGCAMTFGCTADVHDNTLNVENPKVDFDTTVDVDNIEQGQSVPITIKAENVYPVAPDQQPPPEHVKDAVFFKIFLDDEDSTPLIVTAQLSVSVQIPADTEPGDHKLICRMHSHDGAATDVESEIDIKVKARVTTTGG